MTIDWCLYTRFAIYEMCYSMYMFKSIYLENISTNNGYVNTHEHNLKASHMYLESHRQLLTCSLCDLSYCEACGKELSAHVF